MEIHKCFSFFVLLLFLKSDRTFAEDIILDGKQMSDALVELAEKSLQLSKMQVGPIFQLGGYFVKVISDEFLTNGGLSL